MNSKKPSSIYTKILIVLIPLLYIGNLVLPWLNKSSNTKYNEVIGFGFVILVFGGFFVLLFQIIFKNIDQQTIEEQSIFGSNKSLEDVIIEAKPIKMYFYVRYVVRIVFTVFYIVFLIYMSIILSIWFGVIFLSVVILLWYISGGKSVYVIEFHRETIECYSLIYKKYKIGYKYSLRYEKCFLGSVPSARREQGIMIFNGKIPFANLSSLIFGSNWQKVVDEFNKRLPETHLPI